MFTRYLPYGVSGLGLVLSVFVGLTAQAQQSSSVRRVSPKEWTVNKFKRPSDQELRKNLSSMQFEVTQKDGTEPPFQNKYWNEKGEGIYVDVVSGEPLFSSKDKFDSGTGWPSFTRPLEADYMVEREDRKLFRRRIEVRSKYADSHLGHLFRDGPAPTGLRYCINSAALRFVSAEKLAEEGYGRYRSRFHAEKEKTMGQKTEVATLAGGCFWGVEEIIRKVPGVIEASVGYAGGDHKNPRYEDVKTGKTGHAESIRIEFDPNRISYRELLAYFFRLHDPTTFNRQGNDIGTQYRSAVFYHSEDQRRVAEEVKKSVDKSGKWKDPVVTEIVAATEFYPAEDYHQNYLQKNPDGYTCHFLRD